MNIRIFLFQDFATLDVFGPVDILGRIDGAELHYISLEGGVISNRNQVRIETEKAADSSSGGILLVPGGMGTRILVQNPIFLSRLKMLVQSADICLAVCTGSALLAAAGLLDHMRATSNKKSWAWVTSVSHEVDWIPRARWVTDGKFYTSSGVSAGMDMALGFIADRYGREKALSIAGAIEYLWNEEQEKDPFAVETAKES